MANHALDLTTVDALLQYLSSTPFKGSRADVLFGGNANYIYRMHLDVPYRGTLNTVVVKHDQPYIKIAPTIQLDIQRQEFEVEAMKRVRAWLKEAPTSDPLIVVPEIYLFDKENHTVIMEDCGTDLLTLKDFLLSSTLKQTASLVSPTIATALGTFLARMHNWSRSNPDGLLDVFAKNLFAKNISAWVTHGRMIETLDGSAKLPKLEDPPLEIKSGDLEAVGTVAAMMQEKIKTASDIFVMGDFYPGNIMISLQPATQEAKIKHIYIFDWEIARPGIPGVELGQFTAEMIQLQRFAEEPEQAGHIGQLLNDFLSSYAKALTGVDSAAANRKELIRDTLAHCGSHLITWTPRVSTWEDKETCRKVVLEGVELVVQAAKDEEVLYKQSFANALYYSVT